MQNPESLFNPDEYCCKIEFYLTPENVELLMKKAEELNLPYTLLLEIAIYNYQHLTHEEDKFE